MSLRRSVSDRGNPVNIAWTFLYQRDCFVALITGLLAMTIIIMTSTPKQTVQAWKKISEEPYKIDFIKISRTKFELPNGEIIDRDILATKATVCTLPITKDNKVILAKQFRPGPNKILTELPGGYLEKKDTPEQSARRELLEETGYDGDMRFVQKSWASGSAKRIKYHFVAVNCEKVQKQNLDKHEYIDVVEMPLDEFKKHLESGELTDSETGYRGLLFLNLI